jgi:2-oxoisovalerate dehydrogenase E1 component
MSSADVKQNPSPSIGLELMEEALLIRRVEETFLELFSQGKLNGTVHTCVGQEFSAVAFAGQLDEKDFIFSNHRCHGHYISFTKDHYGLIAELMGKEVGVCGGVGSSQHLCKKNFFSNGIQGGIVPVAAGMALAKKLNKDNQIGVVFIGDGTLGEGVVYETMNILSKWEIPLLIVCENNFYAQSTHTSVNLAGDILKRADAFGIKTFKSATSEVNSLVTNALESIKYVRKTGLPAFHLVETYRLGPHSKGDDDRAEEEIERYRLLDPINIFKTENPDAYNKMLAGIDDKIRQVVSEIEDEGLLPLEKYYDRFVEDEHLSWEPVEAINRRQIDLLNEFFDKCMEGDRSVVFLGEDILSPYGGAFKVAKNLSDRHPDRVFSTPISEAAITGISNGLALAGFKPYLEIMFGDFITLSLDQIINHASKFYHMYMKQINCPVVIRTAMGGGRGYGPTHSQTLDKFLVGIDNVTTVALNTLIDPARIYGTIHEDRHPVIVIENKTDYGKKIAMKLPANYKVEVSDGRYPIVRARPVSASPTATIVTYGGMVEPVFESIKELFVELDLIPEIIVLTKISPIDFRPIMDSVALTKKLFVVEEGSAFAGIGSEIIATVSENNRDKIISRRISALPVPIPSARQLEEAVLPGSATIIHKIGEALS